MVNYLRIFGICCLFSSTAFALPSIEALNLSHAYIREDEAVTVTIEGINDGTKCAFIYEARNSDGKVFTTNKYQIESTKLSFPINLNARFFNKNTSYSNSWIAHISVSVVGNRSASIPACLGGDSRTITIMPKNLSSSELTELNKIEGNNFYKKGNELFANNKNALAFKNFVYAANLGHAEAMNAIGHMYKEGIAVPKNYAIAHGWFIKAWQYGSMDAGLNGGILLAQGLGFPVNLRDAYINFAMVAQLSEVQTLKSEAIKLRDEVSADFTTEQLADADKQVAAFIQMRRQRP